MTIFCRSALQTALLTFLILAAAPALSRAAGNPGHAIVPTIVEYDVDPAWPQRPENVQPFGWVSGIDIDDDGQIWIFNKGADPVQVYRADGSFVRTWGKDRFASPHQLRIGPEGNVWVADFGLHVVQKFSPEGKLLMTLGIQGEAGEDERHFRMPTDMAITAKGDVFVTDGYGNRRIVHLDKNGQFVNAWGTYGSEPGQFVLPHAIVLGKKGNLYVADRNSGRIQVFSQSGTFLDQWDQLIMPWGLFANADNDIWVCGSSPHWWKRNGKYPEYKDQIFLRFNPTGRVRQAWSIPLGDIGDDKNNPDVSRLKPGEAVGVHCIAEDAKRNLYVGDIYGERAQKFIPITKRPESVKKD